MLPSLPELIVYCARMMFERKLTDISGGNMSAREGDEFYITPRYAGAKQHWMLEPHDILKGKIGTDAILEDPRCSREARAHLAVYRNFPDVQAVIHAHPYHVLAFCTAEKPIEMVLESTQKFERVELVEAAPSHSQTLADNIVAGLRGYEDSIRTQAAAVLIPRHGILVAGKDLLAALDALERIDWNARCILLGRLID